MERATAYAKSTRKQLDELTKRVQGISALEDRIARLEKQVAALAKESPKRDACAQEHALAPVLPVWVPVSG